jgi:hypothetical protein
VKTYNPGVRGSILAAAALTKHRFVGFDGNVCGAGAKALGVPEVNFDSGEIAGLVCTGIMLVQAGGTVSAAGTALKSDSAGKAIAQAGSGEINGWALDTGGDGDIIRVLLA